MITHLTKMSVTVFQFQSLMSLTKLVSYTAEKGRELSFAAHIYTQTGSSVCNLSMVQLQA